MQYVQAMEVWLGDGEEATEIWMGDMAKRRRKCGWEMAKRRRNPKVDILVVCWKCGNGYRFPEVITSVPWGSS